jgi:hypothetical protein
MLRSIRFQCAGVWISTVLPSCIHLWLTTRALANQTSHLQHTRVKGVLLYGCETWKNSKSMTAKLQVFIDKYLTKVLRIFWPDQITNKELWKRTKQPRIDLQIRKHNWGWLGHTLRKPSDDMARQALQWDPQGKQGRGIQGEERCSKRPKELKRPWQITNPMPRTE